MDTVCKRACTGTLFSLAITAAILCGYASYWVLLYVFSIGAVIELGQLFSMGPDLRVKSLLLNTALFLYAISIYTFNPSCKHYVEHLVIFFVFLVFVLELSRRLGNPAENLGKLFVSAIYIGLPMGLAAQIPFVNGAYHLEIILGLFILIWTNDTFAYLSGMYFGKTKLFARISPNKTIEGFLGGLICTLFAAKVLSGHYSVIHYFDWVVLGVLVSVFGTLGDLVESMFKRQSSVKDSGKLLPGHGGFLDRLDSFLLVIPIAYIYIQYALT